MPGPAAMPAFGFGTYRLREQTCFDAVTAALEAGYRHVDTARMYDNEAAVGRAVRESNVPREEVFVATKIRDDSLAYDDFLASARASLDALGLDAVDLLYVHWPRRTYDPEETLAALDRAVEAGLARHVGLSNFTPDLLEDALSRLEAPLLAHQVEMHPLLPQAELREFAAARDHRLVAYSPLARGEVTAVPELVEVADEHDATPAQVSLAWLSEKGAVPIPKSGTPAHIRENLAALELALDPADVERIDAIDRRHRLIDPEGAPWR